MIDFLKGTVGKDYFSDRLYGCQECIAEYLASKEPLPKNGTPLAGRRDTRTVLT